MSRRVRGLLKRPQCMDHLFDVERARTFLVVTAYCFFGGFFVGSARIFWIAWAATRRTSLSLSWRAFVRAGTAGLAVKPIRPSARADQTRALWSSSISPRHNAGTAGSPIFAR